jgi:hypothetical protein
MKTGQSEWFGTRSRVRAIVSSLCVALLSILLVHGQGVARAGNTPPPDPGQLFGVHPIQQGSTTLPGGHFNFALLPGERISDGIVVENLSDRALRFRVYGADLITAAGGGLAPAQPTATMREAGAWIVVSSPVVTIAAHSQFTDTFTLTLPAMVSPGQHLGAVVAAAEAGLTPQGNPIEARTALITVVTVPGVAQPSARLSPLTSSVTASGLIGFGITLSNTGNVLLTYAGSVNIDDGDGHHVATLPLTPVNAYVVPNGQVQLAAVWKAIDPGSNPYRVHATVTILANGTPVGTLTSQSLALQFPSGTPVPIVVGVAVMLAVLLLLLAWSTRRRARRRNRVVAGNILDRRLTSLR